MCIAIHAQDVSGVLLLKVLRPDPAGVLGGQRIVLVCWQREPALAACRCVCHSHCAPGGCSLVDDRGDHFAVHSCWITVDWHCDADMWLHDSELPHLALCRSTSHMHCWL